MDRSSSVWRCGVHELDVTRTLVMGILNVTPDSFSDGGSYASVDAAVARGLEMVAQGADVVDVGGESTRPGSGEVDVDEELARVVPVVEGLAARGVVVSVDTRHAPVAVAAVAAGASILNDISGFSDPDMVAAATLQGTGLVVMHMAGEPRTMQKAPRYDDVFRDVACFLLDRASHLIDAGVDPARICIDPGFGFGKNTEHNIEVLRRSADFAALGFPLMVAVSRKRTIGELSHVEEPALRVAGSISAALFSVERGASVVRVHDVAQTVEAMRVHDALAKGGR